MKEYQKFSEEYEKLIQLVNSYYVYNDYGEQPRLSAEDIEELNKMYINVFKLASVYLDSVNEKDVTAEKTNMEKANCIQELLQKDMNALRDIRPDQTLPSCLKYANNKVVNITGKKFRTVGANNNTRTMMTITGPDGKPLKGFFTERRYEGLNPVNAPYYVKQLSRQMPQFAKMFEFAVPRICEHNFTKRGYLYFQNTKELDNQFGHMDGYSDALELLNRFFSKQLNHQDLVSLYLGEKHPVSPFETRNVAMSNVAHLLGMDDKIAKSTVMTIRNNGYELQGSFMEFARGEDPTALPGDEGIINMNEASFDHSPVLKTISDMMVLDYICGNADRHANNIFYQCDKDGKVLDIMGIDNDSSFGHIGKMLCSYNSMGLSAIFQMSRSMYDRVMNLDNHWLIHAMDGLSLEKVNQEKTIERFEALKAKIDEGNVIVIEDKDFELYTLSDFTLKSFDEKKSFTYKDKTIEGVPFISVYNHVKHVARFMERIKKGREKNPDTEVYLRIKDNFDSDVQLEFDNDKNIKVEDLEIGTDVPVISELNDSIQKIAQCKSIRSGDFEVITDHLSNFRAASDIIGKDETLLSVKTVTALSEGYKKLLKECNDYFGHQSKKNLKAKSYTPKGMMNDVVKQTAEFCKGRISTMQTAIENTMDKEFAKMAEIREMKNEAQTLMNEGMSEAEVGEYVKSLIIMKNENPGNKQMIAKLGQQMQMCMDYMKARSDASRQDVDFNKYKLSKEDLVKARDLLKEGRLANAELKKEQLKEITDPSSKASVMSGM